MSSNFIEEVGRLEHGQTMDKCVLHGVESRVLYCSRTCKYIRNTLSAVHSVPTVEVNSVCTNSIHNLRTHLWHAFPLKSMMPWQQSGDHPYWDHYCAESLQHCMRTRRSVPPHMEACVSFASYGTYTASHSLTLHGSSLDSNPRH